MTEIALLPFEEVNTSDNPELCFIWLHGLGANGHDFVPIAQELRLNKSARFIFPHAPSRAVTVNGGMVMPAWYDILSMSIEREVDIPQILASAKSIHDLIELQIKQGIQSENIILAGFSQGGAVAYHAALSFPQKLRGLMALSTYFATQQQLALAPANAQIPILIQHGTADPIVPVSLSERATQELQALKLSPKCLTYPMNHSVCADQVHDISEWINEITA